MKIPMTFSCLIWFAAALASAPAATAGSSEAAQPAPLALRPALHTTQALKAPLLASALAGDRIVAVGDRGVVLLSDDNGVRFRQAKSVPVDTALTSVSFVDAARGWAVGHQGVILATQDGGETWALQRSDTTTDRPLFTVYFKDRDIGWAGGLWSLLLATSDGGKTWKPVDLPLRPDGRKPDRNLFRMFGDQRGTLYIAGEQGTLLRSGDQGASWTYLNTRYEGSFWAGLALRDGTLLAGGLRGSIYRSTDGGRTWQASSTGIKSSITDLLEESGKVYAVGLDGVVGESIDQGLSFKFVQRKDRIGLTAATVAGTGKLVAFSRQGVVANDNGVAATP